MKSIVKHFSRVVALALIVPSLAAASNNPVNPLTSNATELTVGRLTDDMTVPVIDGRVDEAAWDAAEPFSTFTQQDPVEGAPATERTEVRLLLGQGHLYIAVVAFDRNPSRINVAQARRDANLTEQDSVILVLDTFNDNQNGFVFGTNPHGIEYDGQVSGEGQSSGGQARQGGAGSQRGGISAFNANWDGDWQVRANITERGWEAEMAIPLRTLRYRTGTNQTWGINVMRNIRHKNEQVYLAPIPRGFDIYRVSMAAKITGLDLPGRRDVRLIPYVLGSANKDFTRTGDQVDRTANMGMDFKWGIRPNLTLDATIRTDFAQVEADEEQVNLTRFDLFFPEKRPFFLENASTFQFGQPQAIDLFFSRRIGLSATGTPIDILGGGRLSGKLGSWNVGVLNIQTDDAESATGQFTAAANNFSVVRAQREVGRSTFGAIAVNRQATGSGAGSDNWNRAFGIDGNWQASTNQRVSAFFARTDSPGAMGSDYAGRAFYSFTNTLWQIAGGYSQVGERFNPEVGFLPRRGYRRPEFRIFFQPQPKRYPWIRRVAPHVSYNAYYDLDGGLQSSSAHIHPLEIQPAKGGRFGWYFEAQRDNPIRPFQVYNRDGRTVVIPAGEYSWVRHYAEFAHDPSAPVTGSIRYGVGSYYDGDITSLDLQSSYRIGTRVAASVGWTRQAITLPYGDFVAHLVPIKASYAFTPLAHLQALLQYNSQSAQFSSNIRLALLDRSGTGLFVVFNDRRDTSSFTPDEMLGRSFVVKYTRLLNF